jgi:two-component system sensor histidine kinase UhpB
MKKELDILIIEDVAADADAVEDELRNSGISFRSRRIQNRDGFLRELREDRPDIVLSDFTLPGFDALEALHILRKLQVDVPFILVTGTRSEEVAVECIREGADDYILKASLKRLPTSITNALQKKAIEHARLRAEAALRRSEEQYRLIAQNTRDLISLIDVDGRFLYASPSHKASLGYVPEELVGSELITLIHPDDRPPVRQAWEQALRYKESRMVEVRIRHRDGTYRIFESIGNWIFDEMGQPQRAVVLSRDITQRKKSEQTLRELPGLIREAQETERRRVSRELHDSVIQILSSVKFRLQVVEEKLIDKDQAAWRDALKAKAHLEKAIQEVRRISRNLRPSELDDLGLVPAVRSLCSEYSERTGVAIDLSTARIPQAIPDDIELNLYRIIQEALGNIEKHAGATEISLRLAREGSHLRVSIRDNGHGFDPAAPYKKSKLPGMGLVDMRERASLLAGRCEIHSLPGTGTEIVIEMPFKLADNSKVKSGEKGKTEEN